MIVVNFNYGDEEIKDFFKFHLLKKDKSKYMYYFSSALCTLAAFLYFILEKKLFFGVILLLISFVLILIFPWQVKRTVNKKLTSVYKRIGLRLCFEEDKITRMDKDKKIVYNWENIVEVDETKKYLYFYISKNQALIVNKETSKLEDIEAIKKMVKNHSKKIYEYK